MYDFNIEYPPNRPYAFTHIICAVFYLWYVCVHFNAVPFICVRFLRGENRSYRPLQVDGQNQRWDSWGKGAIQRLFGCSLSIPRSTGHCSPLVFGSRANPGLEIRINDPLCLSRGGFPNWRVHGVTVGLKGWRANSKWVASIPAVRSDDATIMMRELHQVEDAPR